MKKSILRAVDEFGRISLPIGMRKALDIAERDKLCIEMENDSIILRKFMPGCIFCGSENELKPFDGKLICSDCAKKIAQLG